MDIKSIKGGLLNVQSVGNKTLEIRDLIIDEDFDILAITETWLNEYDSAKIAEMNPDTHTFLHSPREDKRGGGVGVFMNKNFKQIKVIKTETWDTFEHLQLSCFIGETKVTIITVYRPPRNSVRLFINEFRNYLETIDMVSSNVIVCGDFNIWMDDQSNPNTREFIEMMDSLNLVNKVENITSRGGHIIDLIFCDEEQSIISDIYVDEICRLSPIHNLVSFKLTYEIRKRVIKNIRHRNQRNFNSDSFISIVIEEINSSMCNMCDHNIEYSDCITCLTSLYNESLRNKYNQICPWVEKDIEIRDHAPWFNHETLRAKKERKRKENKWRRLRTIEARQEYQHARTTATKLIMKRKKEYYRQKTQEAGKDINKLYKILGKLRGNIKINKLPEGLTNEVLAEKFLNFFDNKIKNIVNNMSDDNTYIRTIAQVPEIKLENFQPVNINSVKSIINRVKLTHCDNDPMPIKHIKDSVNLNELLIVITRIVNLSIEHNNFPISEKKSIIKPIVKGNLDTQMLSSYRPVSNLSFLSKIIENVILDQLVSHLERVQAIPDNQSAYRRLYSTETALCSVINGLITTLDNGKCAIMILLDLSAAFDTVAHDILLEDCMNIGIDGNALDYLKSYLEGREYCVQIETSFSASRPLQTGVPQGSVLGPILFSIYTANLSCLLEKYGVEFKLFADDTQFYMTFDNVQQIENNLNTIMNEISKWMLSKKLKLNPDKTKCMLVGKRSDIQKLNLNKLKINEIEVTVETCVKNLGVLIDNTLSFKEQIMRVVKIAGYHLKNIAFIKKYLDEYTLRMLIHNYVISRLDYCNSLYYGLPNYLLRKIQLVMNRAARLIKGLSPRDRITPTLIELHWLPIKARIMYKLCVITRQALITGKPEYINKSLNKSRLNTTIETRHTTDPHHLDEPRYNLVLGLRAFDKCAPRLYNKLPRDIKDSDSLQAFKKKLKTHLFSMTYDLEDLVIKPEFDC